MKIIKTTDVVVIGGGCMGTSTAFQLAKRGLDVVLCEMRTDGSGSTGRCGGEVIQCYGEDNNIELTMERLAFNYINSELMKAWQEELDIDYGYSRDGSLYLAVDEASAEEEKKRYKYQRSLGDNEIKYLDPKEIADLVPMIKKDVIFGGRFRESDGSVAPYQMCYAFSRGALKHGATIMMHTPVKKVLIENGRATGVELKDGVILSKWVVNCTNAWTKFLNVEETKQVLPCREIQLVTEPIAPIRALCFEVFINGEYCYCNSYPPTGNLSFGGPAGPTDRKIGHYNENTTLNEVRRIAGYMAGVLPALKDVKIIRSWVGTMAFAPDAIPLIGPSTITEGLLHAVGFAAGLAQCCHVGKLMSEQIADGKPSFDWSMYNPGRFLGKPAYTWPDPYDISILHDALRHKNRGLEYTPYNLPTRFQR